MKTALFLWAFYMGFALSISVYRQWLKGVMNPLNKFLFAPVLITFFFLDVIINFGILWVLGTRPVRCLTISERLQVYHTKLNLDGVIPFQSNPAQYTISRFVCEKLLNTIDPSGNHC